MIPPRVVVDDRERASGVPEILSGLGVRVYFSSLPVADYVVNPEVAIERKSIPDLLASIYDGRLFAQASELAGSYRKPYLLVEGEIRELSELTKNVASYYGAIASVTLAHDLRLIHTADRSETAAAIAALVKHAGYRSVPVPGPGAPPKAKDGPRQQLYMVSSLPGVGLKLARRMLERSGTPRKVMAMSESQMAMVPGMGSKRAAKIARALDTPFIGAKGEPPRQEKL